MIIEMRGRHQDVKLSDRGYASGLHAVVADNSMTSKGCEKIEMRLCGMSVFFTRKHFEGALIDPIHHGDPRAERCYFDFVEL